MPIYYEHLQHENAVSFSHHNIAHDSLLQYDNNNPEESCYYETPPLRNIEATGNP